MAGTNRFATAANNKVIRPDGSLLTWPVIINGDTINYPGAPARVEDPLFPMDNLLNADRYSPWATPRGATPSSFALHVDTGTNTIGMAGLFGMRFFDGALFPNNVIISSRTQAETYVASGFYSSTFSGADANFSFSGAPRDGSFILPSPVIGRYWEFYFPFCAPEGFSVGNIFLGQLATDLGIMYSFGATPRVTNVSPVIRSRTGGGDLRVVKVGDDRRLVTLPFRSIEDAIMAKIEAVFGFGRSKDPCYWADYADVVKQVVLATDGISKSHVWAAPNQWDCDVELEVLG